MEARVGIDPHFKVFFSSFICQRYTTVGGGEKREKNNSLSEEEREEKDKRKDISHKDKEVEKEIERGREKYNERKTDLFNVIYFENKSFPKIS